MKTVRCAIRNTDVAAHPEELVRQRLLSHMTGALGYPRGLLAVEKELSALPHLMNRSKVPQRRADILCFGKDIHPGHALYPLLLIECKSIKLNKKARLQIAGYNHFVNAAFICIANQEEIQTGWYDPEHKEYVFIPFLPSYAELRGSLKN